MFCICSYVNSLAFPCTSQQIEVQENEYDIIKIIIISENTDNILRDLLNILNQKEKLIQSHSCTAFRLHNLDVID